MIHFVVALQCEARPLIKHYRLSGRPRGAFRVYERDDVRLIVSGAGKLMAAAATAYLHAGSGERCHCAWLNVGVAGHSFWPLGRGATAHKVTDAASGKSWYPPLVFEAPGATASLCTVDRADADYAGNALYEMEAAGFCAAANRFATSELIHCYKVVSDNERTPAANVTEDHVENLIGARLEDIDALALQLQVLAAELESIDAPPPGMERFLQRWHFTSYERNRLRRALKRWQTLAPQEPSWMPGFERMRRTADVLAALEARVEERPPRYN